MRGKGYGNILLSYIQQEIAKLDEKEIYLTTLHTGLYEKIGFVYINDIYKGSDLYRLYKYNIKN